MVTPDQTYPPKSGTSNVAAKHRRVMKVLGRALLAGAVCVAITVEETPAYATDVPWSGVVTLASSASSYTTNQSAPQLTATVSPSLSGGYVLSIYDQAGVLVCSQVRGGSTSCSAAGSAPLNSSRTFTAYVSYLAGGAQLPQPGPPTDDVRAASAPVTVNNVGYVNTSITLASSASSYTTNQSAPQLTATVSPSLSGGYALSIYDDAGNRVCLEYWAGHSSCAAPASAPLNAARIYTAYVTYGTPPSGDLPTNDVRATSAPVEVANLGYRGSVRLTADTPQNSTVNLTATLSAGLVAPYMVSIYDDSGTLLFCGQKNWVTSFTTTVLLPSGVDQRTYTAYIAQGCNSSGPPTNDVRESSSLTFVGQIVTGSALDGVDVDLLAALAATMTKDEIDAMLVTAPGTHFEDSSVTDQQLAFDLAVEEGKSISQALKIALGTGGIAGGALAVYLWNQFHTPAAPPTAPGAPVPPGAPEPSGPALPPLSAQPTYEDNLTARLLQRNPVMTAQQARTASQTCIAAVQAAIAAGALPAVINGMYPCHALPIFLPGSDNPATTQHDADAIFGGATGTGNLAWIRLNYVSASDKVDSGLLRKWYTDKTECLNKPAGQQCDEYPFYSSAQSGPGASLRLLDGTQNASAGSRYRWFAQKCGLISGGKIASTQPVLGSPFLVIPMAFSGAPPTLRACAGTLP